MGYRDTEDSKVNYTPKCGVEFNEGRRQPYTVWYNDKVWFFTDNKELANSIYESISKANKLEVYKERKTHWKRR